MPSVTRAAPAKINLILSVGPPRPAGSPKAGWHEIASWMSAIDLADEVTVTPAPANSWRASWSPDAPRPSPVDWTADQDLAVRALAELAARVGRDLPARVEVVKRVPVGGGLGGGSSDAAAALLAAREAFGLDVSLEVLREVAGRVSSDAPFFIDDEGPPKPAIVTGFGEVVERVARIRGELVLVLPAFGCPTPAVYAAFDRLIVEEDARRDRAWRLESHAREREGRPPGTAPTPHRVRPELVRSRLAKCAAGLRGEWLFNDLDAAARDVEPRLGEVGTRVGRLTREPVRLSGSGSTLFVVGGADVLARARRGEPELCVLPARLA
jgi:4-diphosphocytidyl-2-C-methyl-D-erythritol kinase